MNSIDRIIADLRRIDFAVSEIDASAGPSRRRDRGRKLPPGSLIELNDEALDQSSEFRHFEEQQPQEIAEHGLDALASYGSLHANPMAWGIFTPVSLIAYLTRRALTENDHASLEAVAQEWLISHEIAHFTVDVAVAQLEILLGDPIWSEFKDRWQYGDLLLEEQVANAHSLRRVRRGSARASAEALRDFMLLQPEGYRDGPSAAGDDLFIEKIGDLLAAYAEIWVREHSASLRPARSRSETFDGLSDAFEQECPIHLPDDLRNFGLPPDAARFITTISRIGETGRFTKKFNKLPNSLQKRWRRHQEEAKYRMARRPGFKKLKGKPAGVYTLRLGPVSVWTSTHLCPSGGGPRHDGADERAVGGSRALG